MIGELIWEITKG